MKRCFFALAISAGLLFAGASRAEAQFHFTFDEFGHGLWQFNDNPTVFHVDGHLSADPTGGIVGAPVMIYDLLVPVIGPGDVGFFEPDVVVAQQISDAFRFYNDQAGAHMIFYSDNVDGADAPADTGIPQLITPIILPETGAEGGPQFCPFVAGDNVYLGVSEGVVPEPTSMVALGIGAIALIRRRRGQK